MNTKTRYELTTMAYPGNIHPERFIIAGRIIFNWISGVVRNVKEKIEMKNIFAGGCCVARITRG